MEGALDHFFSPTWRYNLLRLINERKEELETEKLIKRRENRNRIHVLSHSSLHPLERFPKEVWLMLFQDLSPEDKYNVTKSHRMFHDLLEDGLIGEILLPQVLRFKVDPFWKENEDLEAETLAHFFELRKVSKCLRNGIDRCFEDNLLKTMRNELTSTGPSRSLRLRLLHPSGLDKLRRMQSDLNDLECPHFFLRSLTFSLDRVRLLFRNEERRLFLETFEEMKNLTNDILSKIGKEIWHFSFDFTDLFNLEKNGVPFLQCYILFVGWLRRMPNLKWIKLGVTTSYLRIPTFEIPSEWVVPNLPLLKRVDFVMPMSIAAKSDYAFSVCDEMISKNPQVKILTLSGAKAEWFFSQGLNARIQSLPLEQLRIKGYGRLIPTPSNQSLLRRSNLDNNNWKLRILKLDMDTQMKSIFSVFQFLERFPTLEDVSLCLERHLKIGNDVSMLWLPNLSKFELKFNPEFQLKLEEGTKFLFSLEFLIEAKKLKSFKWTCVMTEDDHRTLRDNLDEEMVNFRGGWADLRESNLWDVFPWMEVVEIRLIERLRDERRRTHIKNYFKRQLQLNAVSIGHSDLF